MKCLFFLQLLSFLSLPIWAQRPLTLALHDVVEDFEAHNCVKKMKYISSRLDNLKYKEFQNELLSQDHNSQLDDLFDLKIKVHKKYRDIYLKQGAVVESCSVATRHALRSIRTAEDYVSANFAKVMKHKVTFPSSAYEPGNMHVKRSSDYPNFSLESDLQSGDVLLTRGNAFTSAAIANLGEFDTQFSHMSIVYKDNTGKLWTVEAHIEIGSVVRPLREHIKDNNYRTMVFRYHDQKLAAKAAKYVFERVKKASETTGNILYDFAFNGSNSDSLFCSEVVSHAFDVASKGKIKIPLFPSRLLLRKPQFVKMLGIDQKGSFIPADIEVDPRFKVVLEWRDANRVQDNLQKDAILHAMFKWNDELGYQMRQSSSSKSLVFRNVAWPLRRAPYLKKYFVNKLPLNMSRDLIGYFGVLESIGELLQEKLKEEDNKVYSLRGIPLMKKEKAKFLDKVRLGDLVSKPKKLHRMYRPQARKVVSS